MCLPLQEALEPALHRLQAAEGRRGGEAASEAGSGGGGGGGGGAVGGAPLLGGLEGGEGEGHLLLLEGHHGVLSE